MRLFKKIFKIFKIDKPKIGDIVVCIDDSEWNNLFTDITLVYNKPYRVFDSIECCHFVGYDIGARLTPSTLVTKCDCGKEIKGAGIHWVRAKRFRKATVGEFIKWLEIELTESVKNEDYLKASEIKNRIEKLKK